MAGAALRAGFSEALLHIRFALPSSVMFSIPTVRDLGAPPPRSRREVTPESTSGSRCRPDGFAGFL